MISDLAGGVNLPLILGAALIASASPGPATLASAGASMGGDRGRGIALAAGITTGSVFWSAASALGFSALMLAHAWMFEIMRYAGAGYLLFLAFKSARSAITRGGGAIRAVEARDARRAYLKGLGLHLTGRWYGAEMVSRLARHLLVDPGGREQRAYSTFAPPRQHGDAAVLLAQRHMDQQFGTALTVPVLATVAGLSERSFVRRFTAATGTPPASYLQALRVEKARGALERSQASIAQIAWDVGYRDVPAFARAFRSITGLTPGAYRSRFRTPMS